MINKTKEDILNDIINSAKEIVPDLNWVPKTPQTDLVSIFAPLIYYLYIANEYSQIIQVLDLIVELYNDETSLSKIAEAFNITIDEVKEELEKDLEAFASNYSITRKDATNPVGVFRFLFSTGDAVSISLGTQITDVNDSTIVYELRENVFSQTPILKDNQYVLDLFCKSVNTGSKYNLYGVHSFNPNVSIPNLISITNLYDVSNGSDKESVEDFVDRIKTYLQGKNVGTKAWFRSLMLEDNRVYDAKIYGIYDGYLERNSGIDIWVHNIEEPLSISDEITYNSDGEAVLSYGPIVDSEYNDNSIYDYTVTDGTERSVYEKKVKTGTPGSSDVISYHTDELIVNLQRVLEDPEYLLLYSPGTVLVRKAFRVVIYMYIPIVVKSGYSFSDVRDRIKDNLRKFIQGGTVNSITYQRKKIFESVDKSDLLSIVINTEGVDAVDLGQLILRRKDNKYPDDIEIICKYNEYLDYEDADVEVIEL